MSLTDSMSSLLSDVAPPVVARLVAAHEARLVEVEHRIESAGDAVTFVYRFALPAAGKDAA